MRKYILGAVGAVLLTLAAARFRRQASDQTWVGED
jgi:hypothetical protein